MNPLEGLHCVLVSRTWMKRSHAWRLRVALPDEVVAAVLANMMERHVQAEIRVDGEKSLLLDPACIVDVPHRGAKCFLDLETVYETQNGCGASLTLLLGREVTISLRKVGVPGDDACARGDVDPRSLRGLHMTFFPNPLFQEYVGRMSGRPSGDPESCKEAFKSHLGVASCTELRQEQVRGFVAGFNAYLAGVRHGT